MDLSAHLAHRARWTPGKAALRFEDWILSYADLERAVSAATPWLLSQGVRAGDRVAFLRPNCPELIEVLYSCARLGAIFVPLNARMPAAELRVFAEQSRPRLLVAEQGFRDVAMATAPQVTVIFRIGSDELLTAERVPPDPGGTRPLLSCSPSPPARRDAPRALCSPTRTSSWAR